MGGEDRGDMSVELHMDHAAAGLHSSGAGGSLLTVPASQWNPLYSVPSVNLTHAAGMSQRPEAVAAPGHVVDTASLFRAAMNPQQWNGSAMLSMPAQHDSERTEDAAPLLHVSVSGLRVSQLGGAG